MPTLDRTCALIAGLAAAPGLPELPADKSGGVQVTIGAGTDRITGWCCICCAPTCSTPTPRLAIAQFDGPALAGVLGRVAAWVEAMRAEIEGPAHAA